MLSALFNASVTLAAFLGMELVAWAAHKYLMHGAGWAWHRSHHEPHEGWFEVNDLYAVVFGAVAVAGFVWLAPRWPTFYWIALGVTAYGVAYFVVHDGLVHQRWPFRHRPRNRYLKRLVQAHKLHHAVDGREHCVSFGFLYAPPVRGLKRRLTELNPAGLRSEAAE